MKKDNVNEIENISLSAKQIKAKLEDSLAYDHDKFRNIEILFTNKPSQSYKLPFSDYKIAISEEMYGQQLLLDNIKKHIEEFKLIEEKVEVEIEPEIIEDDEVVEEEPAAVDNNVNIVEEVYEDDEIIEDDIIEDDLIEEFDEEEEEEEEERQYAQLPYSERAKKPKGYTIKVVDIEEVIRKIKNEAIAKNEGKPVIGRRQINKLLKPYIIKKDTTLDDGFNLDSIDNSLTSIDIYLNAVDKIASTMDTPINKNSNDTLELNIKDILEDLEKKN